MKGKGPKYLQGSYDLVRKHPFIIYSDIIDYKIVADTKILFLRCIPFISKRKSGDIISTGQYLNYQSLFIKIELTGSTCEKVPFVSAGVT